MSPISTAGITPSGHCAPGNTPSTEGLADWAWFIPSPVKYVRLLLELIGIAIVIRIIGLIQPFVFQALIDRVLPLQQSQRLDLILILLIGVTLFSTYLGVLSSLLGTQMANGLTATMGRQIFQHTLNLSLWELHRYHLGDMLARYDEINALRNFLSGTIATLVIDSLFTALYVGILIALCPSLALLVLGLAPLQLVTFFAFGPFLRSGHQHSFEMNAIHRSRLVETFANMMTVKSLAAEDVHGEQASGALDNSLSADWRLMKMVVLNNALCTILSGLSMIVVIYFGAQRVFDNQMTLVQLIAFLLLADKVTGPLLSLSSVWEQWQEVTIARRRLGDWLNRPSEANLSLAFLEPRKFAHLRAENVGFSYKAGQAVFSNISLECTPHLTNVITGDSGCGKSTLAKILAGLYQPCSGTVIFDNHHIFDFQPRSVRQRIVYLAQDPVLFAGTILDNLLLAKPEACAKEIQAVLAASASDRFLTVCPERLQTQVGQNGSHLSGGQRQRLALARALLMRCDVLVLDEPTSCLDPESTVKILATIAQLAKEKTVIVVTHQPDQIEGKKQIINLSQTTLSEF